MKGSKKRSARNRRRRRQGEPTCKAKSKKSVRFAGAAEIPFLLGSPVAHHLAGNDPAWKKGADAARRTQAVRQELTARGIAIPETENMQRLALHFEHCKEIMVGLKERGLLAEQTAAAYNQKCRVDPTTALHTLRARLKLADHLEVVTDELFARPEEAAESETTLSLASGATPSSTSALLLQRKELPTTEACGYEFGCRHLNMGRFLEQLDPDVIEKMLKERGLPSVTQEEVEKDLEGLELDDDDLCACCPLLNMPLSKLSIDLLLIEARFHGIDIEPYMTGKKRRRKLIMELVRPHVIQEHMEMAYHQRHMELLIGRLEPHLEREVATRRGAFFVAVLRSRLHRLKAPTEGDKAELFERLFKLVGKEYEVDDTTPVGGHALSPEPSHSGAHGADGAHLKRVRRFLKFAASSTPSISLVTSGADEQDGEDSEDSPHATRRSSRLSAKRDREEDDDDKLNTRSRRARR